VAYRKLRASRTGFGTSSSLYLGEDHLLGVESTTFTEKYHRFYFSDIQALIVRRTGRGGIWAVVLVFLALLMTTCAIGSGPPDDWTPAPGYLIMALGATILVIVNFIKGPTCTTHIQTSVAVQKIGALHRLKKTREVLGQIRPLIRVSQGSVTKEQVIRDTTVPEEEILPGAGQTEGQRVQEYEPELKNPARFHRFAFTMILVNAAFDILWIFVHGLGVFLAGAAGTMAAFGGIIAALVVQTRRNTPAPTRKITWAAFISFLVLFAASYAVNIYYTFREGLQGLRENGGYDPFSFYFDLVDKSPADKQGIFILLLVSIAITVPLGIAGLASAGLMGNGRAGAAGKRRNG